MTDIRADIQSALAAFAQKPLRAASLAFFKTLGYESERAIIIPKSDPNAFFDQFAASTPFNKGKALFSDWLAADLLFQLTDQEISNEISLFADTEVSTSRMNSYVFFAIELKDRNYPRSKLAGIVRQLNRIFRMPVLALIKHRELVSIAVINRRANKLDVNKDVLEKVTLIKDINTDTPHRGHLDILKSLAISELEHPEKKTIVDFDTLHAAWEQIFNIELLNKRFYSDLANWYFWALPQVDFPADLEPDSEKRRATGLIRLLTRLIFCWFLKEKQLVPERLFHPADINTLLKDFDPENETSSSYYHAILQNLFFATLNQRMGKNGKGQPYRVFAKDEGFLKNKDTYDINNLYRYESLFAVAPDEAIALFADIPFLNGGLFECLDRTDEDTQKKRYIDGFSRNPNKRPCVPDRLFFTRGETADLSGAYGDKKRKKEKVAGLIHILNRYKFTIVENTPIDQEIALDPELLGKVFENLLASYNEETKTTARKQTGSFYTPRPIVDYMVDESLKAHLARVLSEKAAMTENDAKSGLDDLFAYTEKDHAFLPPEVAIIIAAIDELKILDPACGSGAFPMGILHKLVYLLGKLDPNNEHWKRTQLAKLDSAPMRDELERTFADNNDDYGRKLYLIENCLYGVDIQPIAIQITKLRFFISLVADQKTNRDKRDNHGIRPLPNLETKFVAANTLVGLPELEQMTLMPQRVYEIEKEIEAHYHSHFSEQRRDRKLASQSKIRTLRQELGELFSKSILTTEKAKHIAAWDAFDPQASADFFDSQWMFGRSLKGGFDIIIGNPPYLNFSKNKKLSAFYKTISFKTYDGNSDICCLFYERGLQLIHLGGHLCYITSNTWMRANSGESLRNHLAIKTHVKIIIDFPGQKIFKSATVDPNILLFEKTQASKSTRHTQAITATGAWRENLSDFVRQNKQMCCFNNSSSWVILSPIEQSIKIKIEKIGVPLKNWGISINYGIKTGCNEAFIVSEEKRNEILANCIDSNERTRTDELIRPILQGRDIKRYSYAWENLYLLAIHNGVPLKCIPRIEIQNYPAVKKWLDIGGIAYNGKLYTGFSQIRERSDQGDTPYNLRSCAYMEDFSKPKIVYPDIMRMPRQISALSGYPYFYFDCQNFYIEATNFMMSGVDIDIICSFLASDLGFYIFSKFFTGPQFDETGFRYKKVYLNELPIPKCNELFATKLRKLLPCVLTEKIDKKNNTEINQMWCELIGLTQAEIKIITSYKAELLGENYIEAE